MGFLVNKIMGDGTAQTAITNDATLEAVVNSLVAYNTTGGALNFSVLINDEVIFTESVAANDTFRLPDKVNLGASSTLKVNADTGVDVTVSYLQQAIDTAGALSAAQQAAQDASDDADRAEAALGDNSNPIITGSITEQVATMPADALIATDVGTYQTRTFTANITLTNSLTDGQSALYHFIGAGVTYTLTYPTMKWVGGAVPTLTDDDFVAFWMEGSQLWGEYKGTGVQA